MSWIASRVFAPAPQKPGDDAGKPFRMEVSKLQPAEKVLYFLKCSQNPHREEKAYDRLEVCAMNTDHWSDLRYYTMCHVFG